MTNKEIKEKTSPEVFYKIITNDDEAFIGIIEGPYAGHPKAKFEVHQKDYLYVTLLNNQQQVIRLFSEDIKRIEEFSTHL